MISVLIPIFNQPVSFLVDEIHRQCSGLNISFEIIGIEDGSLQFLEENTGIQEMASTRYIVQSENIGRAAIRNKLASLARYNTLIFLDCDSRLERPDFIAQYITALDRGDVIYGGTTYPENCEPSHLLHQKYGIEREARDIAQRQSDPYTGFLTNNFCIKKAVFDTIKFDESLTQYGFEDSLFAWELKKREIPIMHIDNPVVHMGLDTAEDFLSKTKLAISNVHTLLDANKIPKEEIRMADMYHSLKKWSLIHPLCWTVGLFEKPMIKNLKGNTPKLVYLDLLKLKWMRDKEKAASRSNL